MTQTCSHKTKFAERLSKHLASWDTHDIHRKVTVQTCKLQVLLISSYKEMRKTL